MAKYDMDGISDAYFGSSKQYNDYTKYIADREEEKRARQAAINEENKRMSTISDTHYPNNEKNARMRDISPAYNFGGTQYKKILGISDPSFSGGDEYVAYVEYLQKIAEEKPANDHSAVEAIVKTKIDGGSAAGMQKWDDFVSPTFPRPIQNIVQNKMPFDGQSIGEISGMAHAPERLKTMVSTFPGVSNVGVSNLMMPGLGIETMPVVYAQQMTADAEQKQTVQSLFSSDNDTQNMQRLKDEVTEIEASYQDILADDYLPWDTVLVAAWQADKRLFSKTDDILIMFKAQWLHGNRNLIRAAAQKYDIPLELLAGVAWSEVGGDPPWVDPAAYYVRSKVTPYIPEQYWGKAPDMLINNPISKYLGVEKRWSDATKDPQKTSFGDLSMQIRVAAETLGISPEQLDVAMEKEIIRALQKPEFSIFIAAKHLADLKRVDFADVPSDKLTMDQIATIASRYNIGAGASYEKAAGNSYGKAVKKHLPFIMEYCLQD